MDECDFKKQLKEKDELIAQLEEGISDEIDNLREEIKKIKKKNELLEERDKDFQRNFEADRKIFKEQLEEIDKLKSQIVQKASNDRNDREEKDD